MPTIRQKLAVLSIILSLISYTGLYGQNAKTDKQQKDTSGFRNVVFILGDDHSAEVVGCYGNDIIHTPRLDQMAANGIMFANAYANAPVCNASRQSILTGKYPHATGVNLLFTPFPDQGNITIAEHLGSKGFKTGVVGKTHFNNWIWAGFYQDGLPSHGFQYWIDKQDYKKYLAKNPPKPVPDSIETWQQEKATHIAYQKNAEVLPAPCYDQDCEGTYFANKAVDFIKQNQDNRFCLWVGFHEPHAPFSFPIEYRNKYQPENMPLPQGSPEDDRWVPEVFRDLSEAERRGIIAAYYTSVEYMDKNTGIILDALDSLNLTEETLIIYVGDQGYLLNDHKRFEKHTMWEEAIKAPFIMKAGGKFGTNRKVEALTEFIDLVPTALDALEIAPIPEVQGKSLMPLLKDKTSTHKKYVFAEFLEDNKAMVATQDWKYIFTSGKHDLGQGYATGYGPSGIVHRLYHLKKDSYETHDVSKLPENQQVLNELQNQMLKIFKETHPDAEELPDNLTKIGQLVWFCEPRDVGAEPGGIPLPVFEK